MVKDRLLGHPHSRLITNVDLIVGAACAGLVLGVALLSGGFYPRSYAGLAVVAWWGVGLILVLTRWPDARPARIAVGAGACLAGLALLQALSILWADDAGLAYREAVRSALYAGAFILAAICVAQGRARAALAGVSFGIVLTATVALGSRLFPGLLTGEQTDSG